jgi:hypothetical protein
MYNDANDFGEAAKLFVLSMVIRDGLFSIIDTKVEEDAF